jgi:hypothetical protein
MEDKAGVLTDDKLREQIPTGHRKFVEELLDQHGIDSTHLWNGNTTAALRTICGKLVL